MPKLRYCVVNGCENFKGCSDSNIHMFRTPTEEETRKQWIDAIHEANGSVFTGVGLVCQLHFLSNELISTKRNIKLRKNTIPSQFLVEWIEPKENEDQEFERCENCEELNIKIQKIEAAAMVTKSQYEVERQKLLAAIKKLNDDKRKNMHDISELKGTIMSLNGTNAFLEKVNANLKVTLHNRGRDSGNDNVELLDCLINGVLPGTKYPETVRQFSLTLSYLSGRGYDFVRKIFNNNLPGRSTIRTWYANSDLDCTPGINSTALKLLEQKAFDNKEKGKELICSLCFDEMYIRQHMQWCQSSKIMLGLPTIGENSNQTEDVVLAKQVIVYMLNVIDERFQIPIAYHLITSLNGNERAELLKEIIGKLTNIGVTIINVAFDGFTANGVMSTLLGANLDVMSDNFRPYFFNGNGQKIFLMYDNCHMLKLMRNTIGNVGTIMNGKNEKIQWSFFEKLIQFSKTKGFAQTHKMNRKHIEFRKNIMKVQLAVQTLSASVAKSMILLKNNDIEEFKDASATAEFAQTFNDLFDIFNTKNDMNEHPFKAALNTGNKDMIISFFEKATEYIKQLCIIEDDKTKYLIQSKKKTGGKGFIINMKSLVLMFQEYVEEKKVLNSIPTFWLNQDHLEVFFGKSRSLNGFNDNPTAQHFAAAFSKLLANDSVLTSKHANCRSVEAPSRPFSNILSVSSGSTIKSKEDKKMPSSSDLEYLFKELEKIEATEKDDDSTLQECTIAAIAEKIEKRLKSLDRTYCPMCKNIFDREDKVPFVLVATDAPCVSTFRICKQTDRFLKLNLLKGAINFETIQFAIFDNIKIDDLYNGTDFTHQPDHKLFLIKEVVEVYIQIKGCYLAKSGTLNSHKKLIRSEYHKEIHFRGQ